MSDSPASSVRAAVHFFALALGITWALQTPGVLAQNGLLPGPVDAYMPFVILGVFGPLLAAWILTRRAEGKEGTRLLFGSLFRSRPGWGWMLLALLLPGVLLSLGLALRHVVTGEGAFAYPPDPPGRIIAAILISIGEEVGWRGFALPKLSRGIGRIRASLVIGVIWSVWHIPMFLGEGTSLALMPLLTVYFCAGSLVFTWFYFRTGASLLIAVLLHLGAHMNNSHLAFPDASPFYIHTVGFVLLAAALVIFDRKTFAQPTV